MENRREYARVDAKLPFKESIEDARSLADLSPRVAESAHFEFPSPPSYLYPDTLTADWIKYFDTKINTLADVLMAVVNAKEALPTTNVNISTGGVSFDSGTAAKRGEVLEMRISFDGNRMYYFYGEVVWTKNISENKYRVGTNFLNMSNEFVDEINRFVLSRQREILNRKSAALWQLKI